MNKAIAFFDFDGTITTKDTLLEFIKFSKGTTAFYVGFAFNIFYLLGYKLKLISNQKAKEKVLQHFFGGMKKMEFDELCRRFTTTVLPTLIRPKAVAEIKALQKKGVVIAVVSASPENWIAAWCSHMQVALIASRLQVKEQRITGKIVGKNCHGQEKVRRIMEAYNIQEFEVIYAYGDTRGDRPMLKMATRAHFRPFC